MRTLQDVRARLVNRVFCGLRLHVWYEVERGRGANAKPVELACFFCPRTLPVEDVPADPRIKALFRND
jgi:hypothetical protein